jgi:hypothetical protein
MARRPSGFLRVIGLVVLAAVAWVEAARSETPADISARIVALLAALPSDGSLPDELWRAQAESLRARLASFPQADPAAAAAIRATELDKALTALRLSTNQPLVVALTKLIDAAATIEANDPVPAFEHRVASLNTLATASGFPVGNPQVQLASGKLQAIAAVVDNANAVLAFENRGAALAALVPALNLTGNYLGVRQTATKLLKVLEELEIADPAAAIVRRADTFTAVLKTFVTGKPIASAPTVRTGLQALSEELKLATASTKPRIHIVEARFGDLTPPIDPSRVCNAAPAMVTQCERRPSCVLTAAPPQDLCGFDPAPRTEDRFKGVKIAYQCLVADDAVWARLAASPGTHASGAAVRVTVLRKSTQSIVCLQAERE